MAIPLVAVGGKITAALLNSIIRPVNGIALNGIVPSSVAGTGVVVSPNGAITLTNAGNVSVNGVFSGTYDNYRITWNSPTRSIATSISFRLRGAGTDISTTTYDFVKSVVAGTTATVTSSSASTGFPLDVSVTAGQSGNGVMDIFGPALANATTATVNSVVIGSSAASLTTTGAANENATAYDGFTIYPTAAATWSGMIRVYGYNNLT